RLHAQLREDAEGSLHRAAADDAFEVAGQAEGTQGRAAPTPASSHPGARHLPEPGRPRALSVLRGADERPGPQRLPSGSGATVVLGPAAPQPAALPAVAPDEPIHRPV